MDRYLLISLSFILLLLQSSIFPFLFGGVHQPDIWLVSVIIDFSLAYGFFIGSDWGIFARFGYL